MIKTSGEKVSSLLGGVELEKKILSEGEVLLREKKPKILVFRYEDRRMEALLEPVFSEATIYIFGRGHISEQLAPLAEDQHFPIKITCKKSISRN